MATTEKPLVRTIEGVTDDESWRVFESYRWWSAWRDGLKLAQMSPDEADSVRRLDARMIAAFE